MGKSKTNFSAQVGEVHIKATRITKAPNKSQKVKATISREVRIERFVKSLPKKSKDNKAFVYCRVNGAVLSPKQRHLSIASQKKSCEKYCKEHNLIIDSYFEDCVISRAQKEQREIMKKAIRSGKSEVKHIVVYRFSQLMRSFDMRFYSDIIKKQVIVHSVMESL